MLIKAKGPNEVGLRYTRPRDIVKVDFDANMMDGPDDLQPPSESFLHIWVYKTRPDVKSVVHCHPEHAVLLTIARKEIFQIYGAYHGSSGLARDGVPVYPSSRTIGDDKLGQDFAKVMGNHKRRPDARSRDRCGRHRYRAKYHQRFEPRDPLSHDVQGLPARGPSAGAGGRSADGASRTRRRSKGTRVRRRRRRYDGYLALLDRLCRREAGPAGGSRGKILNERCA